jgi:Zn finger protein HypA/HybF involved in hydrogenase expression
VGISGKAGLPVALGLVALAILVGFIQMVRGCHHRVAVKKPLSRPFWCEQCQEEFMAPYRNPTAVCPKCKQETTIVRHYYVCAKCGERFLAFDVRMSDKMARLPGGDWDQSVYHLSRVFECPKCGSTDTALEKYTRR